MTNIKISLAAARVNAKLNQKEVAKYMKVSNNTLVNWENGISHPSVEQAEKLSKLYKIPLDAINFFSA